MVESLKIIVHSLAEKLTAKLPEMIGLSFTGTAAIITGLSIIELINGLLQTIALIITIAGGIATYRYIKKKEKALPDNNTGHGNRNN